MPSFLWPQGLQGERLPQHSPRPVVLHPQSAALLRAPGSLPKWPLRALGDLQVPLAPPTYQFPDGLISQPVSYL